MAPRFVNCKGCARHFNTDVKEDFTCCLCNAIDACTSNVDIDVLTKSEQCRICGNFSKHQRFGGPICDYCVQLAANERWSLADIPVTIKIATGFEEKFKAVRQAMMLPPPSPASISPATAAATQILASAQNYQNNASMFRLGKTATFSSSSHNLPKVNNVLKERQRARAIAQKSDNMIAVVASLWRVEGSSKERLVTNTSVKERFPETDLCSKVVSHLFDRIKDSLLYGPTMEFVYLGKCLQFTNITIGALVGKTTHYILTWDSFEDNQLIELFNHFHRHQYFPKTGQDNRTVTLAFKFDGEMFEEHEALKSVNLASSQLSRRSGRSSIPQKRGRSESMSSTTPAPPPRLSSIPTRLFLPSTSAIQRFSRNPPLVEVPFNRIMVQVTDNFTIAFVEGQVLEGETFHLASRVSSGKPELTGSSVRDREILQSSGWIGEGETKTVRYCRMKNLEYAFSQVQALPMGGVSFTNDDNTNMIEHEVGLHHLATQVKQVFDQTLIKCGVCSAPDFYFAPNVIYGQVNRSQLKDSNEVPFEFFVAYPLLPTGPNGGKLVKYTGSDSLGEQPSPRDLLALTIHAFAHFSLYYSQGTLVFTDLQGLYDKMGKMCLFDVQAHTNRPGFDVYFNRGDCGIKSFLDQHEPMCPQNPFCQKLGLHPGCVDKSTNHNEGSN